jgi:hypothetical protein
MDSHRCQNRVSEAPGAVSSSICLILSLGAFVTYKGLYLWIARRFFPRQVIVYTFHLTWSHAVESIALIGLQPCHSLDNIHTSQSTTTCPLVPPITPTVREAAAQVRRIDSRHRLPHNRTTPPRRSTTHRPPRKHTTLPPCNHTIQPLCNRIRLPPSRKHALPPCNHTKRALHKGAMCRHRIRETRLMCHSTSDCPR